MMIGISLMDKLIGEILTGCLVFGSKDEDKGAGSGLGPPKIVDFPFSLLNLYKITC